MAHDKIHAECREGRSLATNSELMIFVTASCGPCDTLPFIARSSYYSLVAQHLESPDLVCWNLPMRHVHSFPGDETTCCLTVIAQNREPVSFSPRGLKLISERRGLPIDILPTCNAVASFYVIFPCSGPLPRLENIPMMPNPT